MIKLFQNQQKKWLYKKIKYKIFSKYIINPEEEGKEEGKVEKKRLRKTDSNSSVSSDELLPLRKEGRTGEEKVDVI